MSDINSLQQFIDVLEQERDQLKQLLDQRKVRYDFLEKKLKHAKNTYISSGISQLQQEVGALDLALLHHENAIRWFSDLIKILKKQHKEE